jgi:hypothetical protein
MVFQNHWNGFIKVPELNKAGIMMILFCQQPENLSWADDKIFLNLYQFEK